MTVRSIAALWIGFVFLFAPAPLMASGGDDASKYIDRLASQTLEIISNAKMSTEQKRGRLEQLFSRNVDIPWVGKFVMGRYWREASDVQRATYLQNYQAFILRHYTSRFTDYNNGTFRITGTKDDGDGEYTVNMLLLPEKAQDSPVMVDYRVRKTDKGGFKIFDLIIEGVSMITTQRSEFSSVITSKGIDALISQLATKAQDPNYGK